MLGTIRVLPATHAGLVIASGPKGRDALLCRSPGTVEGILEEIAGLLVIAHGASQEGVQRSLAAIQQRGERFQRAFHNSESLSQRWAKTRLGERMRSGRPAC